VGALTALVLGCFLPISRLQAADDSVAADEDILKKSGITPDGPGLLEFFRKRSLNDADRQRLDQLVRQLGSRSYTTRMKARKDLISIGPPALPFLEPAVSDPDLEIVRLAKECLSTIKKGPGPSLPAAAARLLARRRPPGAVDVLLRYVPYIEDEVLEEEIFTSLGMLALNDGAVDPLLTAALRDSLSQRRAAAAFILGQMGGPDQRVQVRRMLTDADPLVRRYAAQGLVGKEPYRQAAAESAADVALLKEHKKATDTAGLLALLRKHSLTDMDRRRLQELVGLLGDRSYKKRSEATADLIAAGPASLPFLRSALMNPDAEIVKRAKDCIDAIEKGSRTSVLLSAIRLLVSRAPPEAVKSLLHFVPSADDEALEEAVLQGLCALGVRGERLDPVLVAALENPKPARRAAAAYVLGRIGAREHCDAVRARLRDPDRKTRLRAAQGLLFAKDRSALPVFLDLLGEDSVPELAALAESVLRSVAGEFAPDTPPADGTADERKKARAAWLAWYLDRGSRVDLSRLTYEGAERGLTVICEFDGTARGKGQVWEFGRDFKPRWKIDGLDGPMDAHMLSSDRVLIAEYYSMRVSERDTKGDVKWEHRVSSYPIACGRMRNGNIFIATYTNLIEVTREHRVVHDYNRGGDGQIYSAQKLPNGHIIYMTSLGNVVELDGANGRVLHKFNVGYPGAWCGVEWLSSGRYLVCLMASGKVMEVDTAGRASWEMTVTGAHQTLRLRNGHLMVVCMNNKRLVEVDRARKKIIWDRPMEGRPWRVHRR
jgi:HEAT repeat protein